MAITSVRDNRIEERSIDELSVNHKNGQIELR